MTPSPTCDGLRLSGITAGHPGRRTPVLEDLELEVADGELLALLGPSGCGKTTTVQVASGLLPPSRGTVELGGSDVTRTPPERRRTAVVFQQPLLLPHLTAVDNVAFPARVAGLGRREARIKAHEHLQHLGVDTLADRYPRQLSGGQAQRVALARALAARPRVLLLDEPFSALDTGLRHQMRDLLSAVQRELRLTTLLVTHDQAEAAAVADAVAVMHDGRILQRGAPAELYARPASRTVARFLGCHTALPGTVTQRGRFRCALGDLALPAAVGHRGPGWLVVRPESITPGDGEDSVPAVARTARPEGAFTALTADTAAGAVHALLPPGPHPSADEPIRLRLPLAHRWVVADSP
ncbi:ABC transporter ATP-binding protein [Streptomyces ovatisporus]|uniref:ABC transporter ATP-binding protein n=1 Tax=Streptomyces ovatisporus TaxID=1128682 RepID=A0ABV9A6P5_9ACTN